MTPAGFMVREELRLLWREGHPAWALAAFIALVVIAAANGRALLDMQHSTAEALQSESRELIDALTVQAERGVEAAASAGSVGFSVLHMPVVLPAAPAAPLAIGLNDLLPSHFEVTARGAHVFLGRTELDSPLRLSLGNFDVAFVIVWLLPLVVIGLMFNVISAERERGVLALAVAAGRNPRRFVLGKCLARLFAMLGSLWVALLMAAVLAGLSWDRAEALLTFVGWLCGATLYALFWFALALLVNARSAASDRNAATLVGAWLLLVILAPALTNLIATTVFPAPSRVELTTELREATEQADRDAAATRDRYFFDHPDMQGQDMDQNEYFRSVARSEAGIARSMLPLLARFETQSERQQSVVEALQYLSPGTLSWQLLTGLSGSDGARHREFRAQTLRFHERWVEFFVTRLEANQPLTRADYAAIPRFEFRESSVATSLRRAAGPVCALSLMVFVIGGWALRRLGKLSVS
jgi:ABC-2 type transport system permease protein